MATIMKNIKAKKLIHYDQKSDVFYIGMKGVEEECIEVSPGVNVELNERGKVIGIEILNASRLFRDVTKSMHRHMQVS